MKLDQLDQLEKAEKQIEAPIPYEKKLLSSMRRKPGLKLFSFNPKTKDIQEVECFQTVINLDNTVHRKVKFNPDFDYVQALNRKNALKHFNKLKR
jgi:hypothetical protein